MHCSLICLFVLPGNSVKYDPKINPVYETLIKEALEGFYYINSHNHVVLEVSANLCISYM